MSRRRFPWHRSQLYWSMRLLRRGYLRDVAWFTSAIQGESIDADGDPQPWITYPCIDFLTPRVQSDWSVFEYGCGNSTRWWAKRTRQVRSCEHELGWFEKIRLSLPANCELIHRPLDSSGAYERSILEQPQEHDIVIIDGRHRVACAGLASTRLSRRGILLWDNTERAKYQPGMQHLREQGFRQLDFWGMSPITIFRSCTSIFYRSDNCLGI